MDITKSFFKLVDKARQVTNTAKKFENKTSFDKPTHLLKKSTDSPFLNTATAIRDEITELHEQIRDYTRYYLRNEQQGMDLNQSDHTKRIQSYLHDATQHIQGLKNLLEYAERKHNLSSHQRAYYHSILLSLFKYLEDVSRQYKSVREMIYKTIDYPRVLFDRGTINADKIKSLEESFGESDTEELHITENQKMMLESENHMLHTELNLLLQDVQEAERSAIEVGELIATFHSKVNEQAETIKRLEQNTEDANLNIRDAHDELQKTKSNQNRWRNAMITFFIVAGLLLLFLHFIN